MTWELPQLFLAQIIAHLISDFYLQNQKISDSKDKKGFRSGYLYLHGLITFAVAWALSWQLDFALYAGMITAAHITLDGLKPQYARNGFLKRYAFFLDQALHLSIILAVTWLYDFQNSGATICKFDDQILYIVFCYLLMVRPTNFVIQALITANQIEIPESNSGLLNAGRLIGSTERLLAITLVFNGAFSALGFIIAAKSILRFKDSNAKQAEYVLIGSLLSFSIAIFAGLGLEWFFGKTD